MSMQNETKRRSPSIIARLMGLDGLPPQSSSHKQAKSVENQQCRPITSEKACGKKAYGDLRGSMEEQKFKDVFEVFDVEKEKSDRCLYQRRVDANLSEAEMAFIRQKFMEAKRLSADEKLQYSKEFIETLGSLDSNKDLLLKFIQHPDSLFTDRLPGFQTIDPKPHSSQATTLKFSNSPNHVDNFETLKVYKDLLGKSHNSPQWHGGDADPSLNETVDLSSKKQLKKRSSLKLTAIVVLKPNIGKPQTTSITLPSQISFCDDVRAYHRLPCTRNQESKAFDSLKAYEDSRAIARIVSRQMKESCGSDSPMNFEILRFRGYAGDESSSGSDSSSESKLMSAISRTRTDFNRNNHHPSLPFSSSKSSVRKEAMKRLSDRWNLSYKSEQEIEIRRSNTLAEMLATSDREVKKERYNGITFKEGLSKRFESSSRQPELLEPIGSSSRYSWKSNDTKDRSKSRTIMHQDRTCGYTIVLPKKLTTRDRLVKRRSSYSKEMFLSDNSMPVSTNSHMSYNSSSEINRPSSSKVHHMDGELYNEKLPPFKTQRSLSVHSDTENGSVSEKAKTTLSVEPPELSAVTSLTNLDIAGMPTEEVDQSSIPQLYSLENAREGDQPSSVSILPTSFHRTEFLSSSCFESLNADLQGLRMQFQLLRTESATHNEGSMLVPSNEEADKVESSLVTNETLIIQEPGEDWKSLYLADVLADSRFIDLNPKSFMAAWYYSESPADPSLFEDLDKKYSCLKTSTRLERKLLFDMINSEILEIFEQFTDLQPTKVCPKWDINRIQETLHELVTEKYMKPSRDTKEEELHWPNLKDDIDEVIGKEIEEMLTDELIAELVVREVS